MLAPPVYATGVSCYCIWNGGMGKDGGEFEVAWLNLYIWIDSTECRTLFKGNMGCRGIIKTCTGVFSKKKGDL